jgi:hypothetical protein
MISVQPDLGRYYEIEPADSALANIVASVSSCSLVSVRLYVPPDVAPGRFERSRGKGLTTFGAGAFGVMAQKTVPAGGADSLVGRDNPALQTKFSNDNHQNIAQGNDHESRGESN